MPPENPVNDRRSAVASVAFYLSCCVVKPITRGACVRRVIGIYRRQTRRLYALQAACDERTVGLCINGQIGIPPCHHVTPKTRVSSHVTPGSVEVKSSIAGFWMLALPHVIWHYLHANPFYLILYCRHMVKRLVVRIGVMTSTTPQHDHLLSTDIVSHTNVVRCFVTRPNDARVM